MSEQSVVEVVSQAAAPPTVLERLLSDRAGLTSELAVLNASSARLRETANAEAAVLREIDALTRADAAAMTAWASSGCVGNVPVPDQKQRRVLAERLASAQAAAAAAKGAGQDIDHQISEMNGRLRYIESQIEEAALDVIQAEVINLGDQHLAATIALRKVSAKMLGFSSYLSNEGRCRFNNGDQAAARVYLARAEALTRTKLANPGVMQDEVIEAMSDWSRRAADLRKGASS